MRAIRREYARSVARLLRIEAIGGTLLVLAAIAALIIANTPLAQYYAAVRDWRVGPAALDLHLTIGAWAADGLLAIFFFLAGLELKREFVVGELRKPRLALVPILAAVGGMAAPAGIYALVNLANPGALAGWAVPTATDIAFALAVLAVVGRSLPSMVRTFLLTLAVVDDLLAITIIAVFYTHQLRLGAFVLSLVAVAVFAVVIRSRRMPGWLRFAGLTILALIAWALMHASGVHATVAGVLLGLVIPIVEPEPIRAEPRGNPPGASPGAPADRPNPTVGIATRIDDALRPVSAGVAVPIFAFFAAGVTVGGLSGLAGSLGNQVTLGVALALVVGKTIGIFMTTVVASKIVKSPLLRSVRRADLLGLSVLGGIGFTVSLLIGQLAFADNAARLTDVQIGVLTGSLAASVIGAIILAAQNRRYRREQRQEGATAGEVGTADG